MILRSAMNDREHAVWAAVYGAQFVKNLAYAVEHNRDVSPRAAIARGGPIVAAWASEVANAAVEELRKMEAKNSG